MEFYTYTNENDLKLDIIAVNSICGFKKGKKTETWAEARFVDAIGKWVIPKPDKAFTVSAKKMNACFKKSDGTVTYDPSWFFDPPTQ
jgi:hypothetical protein